MGALVAVRDGLATRLAAISGLRVYDTVPDSVAVPAAVVTIAPGDFLDYDVTLSDGADNLHFSVLLLVSKASERAGQDQLDGYLAPTGASSVKAALEGDNTLGGVSQWVAVSSARNYGYRTVGDTEYLGCELAIDVGV